MNRFLTSTVLAGLLGLSMIRPPVTPAQEDVPPPPPAADAGVPDGAQVQARGQVHEAYGEPSRAQAVQGILVDRTPPAPIEEAPPEDKPAGDNVAWITGYWGWDDEAKDFVWVSGFWRVLPPGRTWVPGTWQQVTGGYQWVSGYWGTAAVENQEVQYLPPPPALVDSGPSVPAPEATSNYVPGNWLYRDTRYLWRPGYWVAHRPGWVWVPASYRWTPAGYLFVAGYWDRPLLQRGLLFAPLRFTRPTYLTRGFVYRPSFVIQPDFLLGAMFVRNDAPCYYFGDYFTPAYQRRYVSWVNFRPNRYSYDANYGYYRSTYAGNPAWDRNLRTLYTARYNGDVPRPPRTLVLQNKVINNITINKTSNTFVNKTINITNVQNQMVLSPLRSVKNVRVTALASLAGPRTGGGAALPAVHEMRLERVSPAQRAQEQKAVTRYRAISKERAVTETRLTTKAPRTPTAAPIKVQMNLPRSTPPARIIRPATTHPAAPAADAHHTTTAPRPVPRQGEPTPRPTPRPVPAPKPHPTQVPMPTPKPHPAASPAPVHVSPRPATPPTHAPGAGKPAAAPTHAPAASRPAPAPVHVAPRPAPVHVQPKPVAAPAPVRPAPTPAPKPAPAPRPADKPKH